jgi:hypothetical protein
VIDRRGIAAQGRIAIAMAVVVALALCSSAQAAITLHDADGSKLARFSSLRCKTSKGKGFTGTATGNGWNLTVRIQPFDGFHPYHVGYGATGKAAFFVKSGSTTFSNTVKPQSSGLPETGEGGNIAFPGGSGKIGIAFGTAFSVGDLHEYASLFGLATCN